MRTRKIGAGGPLVDALGLGCLNPTGQYDEPVGVATTRATVNAAIERGMTLFDTADSYGTDNANELFVGEVISGRRNEVTLSTKFGVVEMAWLLAQGDYVVPIAGSDRPELVAENAASADLVLSQDDLDRVEDLLPIGSTGNRYWDMSWADGKTPEVIK